MIKNIMYLSITAFMLFKLCDGIDWHKVDATVYRTYQGAAAGFAETQATPTNKPTQAILPAASVVVPVPADAAKAAVPEEVAGCQDECEGDDNEEPVSADVAPVPVQGKTDSPTVVNLPQPNEIPAVTNGQ